MKIINPFYKAIIISITALSCVFGIGCYVYYRNTLVKQEKKYIDNIYKKSFAGRIIYLKEYEKNSYVLSIKQYMNGEFTIGKVTIKHFDNVIAGDSIIKEANSFEIAVIRSEVIKKFVLEW